ncbi:hypothetical protein ACHAQH_008161 [Verticillium albo-atrum]
MVVINRFNGALDSWGRIGHSDTSSLFRVGSNPSKYMEDLRYSITQQVCDLLRTGCRTCVASIHASRQRINGTDL